MLLLPNGATTFLVKTRIYEVRDLVILLIVGGVVSVAIIQSGHQCKQAVERSAQQTRSVPAA